MPALKAAQKAHPDVDFVLVNQGESVEMVEHFLTVHSLQMNGIVVDPAKQVSTRTGSAGFPTTLFYDANGRMQLRHVGELSQATLKEKIDGLRP